MRRPRVVRLVAVAATSLARWTHAQQPIEWPSFPGAEKLPRQVITGPPTRELGSAAGRPETLFAGVLGAVRFADGSIAVADAGNFRITIFDQAGNPQRTTGRRGDGPGEFKQPRWFGRCGRDRVGIQDGSHTRLTLFANTGALLDVVALPVGANFDPIIHCSAAGPLLMLFDQLKGPVERGSYIALETKIGMVRGLVVDTVTRPGTREHYIGRNTMMNTTVPFGDGVVAGSGAGSVFACGRMSGACIVLDTLGRVARSIALGLVRRKASKEDWNFALSRHYDDEPSRALRNLGPRLLQEIRPRKEFPKLERIAVDPHGNLWIKTFANWQGSVAVWLVVSPEGDPKALVGMPRALQVTDLGADHVVGFVRDADGVEFVQVYRYSPIGPVPPNGGG